MTRNDLSQARAVGEEVVCRKRTRTNFYATAIIVHSIGVPALWRGAGTHGVRARGELHAPGRHLEDVRSAGRVEHVRPLKETRERLAVLAVADEAEAAGRGNVACDS